MYIPCAGRLEGLSWGDRYSYCLEGSPSPQQLQQQLGGHAYFQVTAQGHEQCDAEPSQAPKPVHRSTDSSRSHCHNKPLTLITFI